MYYSSTEELKKINPFSNGVWNKEYLCEYLICSCNSRFEKYIDAYFQKYLDNEQLAKLLFSILSDDEYDGSDCQMGVAYYIAKLDKELLRKNKELLLHAQENEIHWKRPFRTDDYLKWLNN